MKLQSQICVLQVQKMEPEKIAEAFRWLRDNEAGIRGHLEEMMPGYVERAGETAKILAELIKE